MIELRKLNDDEKHKWLSSRLSSDKSFNEIDSELLVNDYDVVYSGEEHHEETTDSDIEFE